ncbi:MAG TPA: DUF6065 family protein [Xanthobacteraceae bacterium]|nr:DUF6065 family protein [Xanthobacteraceae bacterium]
MSKAGRTTKQLRVYVLEGQNVELRPAPVERDWMDQTPDRFAYRCLPLNIANALGWELLCPTGFTARWNGQPGLDSIEVVPDRGTRPPAVSHFGSGLLTFHVPCLFRTEPGFDLVVQGPVNSPKDGIYALSGVIETDWAPYSFTMNWMFTRAGVSVRFEKGEPICHLFPVSRGWLEQITPELHVIAEEPELQKQHALWQFRRGFFNTELTRLGSVAQSEKWQKLYYRGLNPDGSEAAVSDHRTRVRLKPFVKSSAYSRR